MARVARGQDLAALNQDLLQDKLHPVYLFYGEEEFLIAQAFAMVQKKVLAGIPVDFNFDQFYAKECTAQPIVDSAKMLPMMAPRRLTLVRDVFDLKGADLGMLCDYTEDPSPTTVLLMVAGSLRNVRRPAGNKAKAGKSAAAGAGGKKARRVGTANDLVKAARKVGHVVEFRTLYERDVRPWIKGEVSRLGKRIDERGVTYLLDMVGENLRELHSELIKVSLFIGDKPQIELNDLQAVVSDVSAEAIFSFTRAVGFKDAGTALLQLSKMFEADPGKAGGKVLGMLHRHFEQLYRTRILLDTGMQPKEIAKQAGVRDNMVWKWEKEDLVQAKRRSRGEIVEALMLLYEATLAQRTSRAPLRLQIEGLILKLC